MALTAKSGEIWTPNPSLAPRGIPPKAAFQWEGERNPMGLVGLTALMNLTSGSPEIKIGLIDGPVAKGHPAFVSENIRQLSCTSDRVSARADGDASMHGTFIAGMLSARRGSGAPAICPDCVLLVRPIFADAMTVEREAPGASPRELGAAIIECVEAGARVLNLSLALTRPSVNREYALEEALDLAMRCGVIVVAAAGNQGTIGTSAITRHPWVIPTAACDLRGWPLGTSNLAGSIGRRGLSAPGERITSLSPAGEVRTFSGTSFAVPFVTGAVALLWSAFPTSSAAELRAAVT